MAQTILISGRVVNGKNKESLPFVNVTIKNTIVGTTTDVEGRFTMRVPETDCELIFTYVGFKTYIVAVK